MYGDRERDSLLPDLHEGQLIPDPGVAVTEDEEVQQGVAEVRALRHETSPPARYTEASLVKKLEEEGIGRPSTYASIITTIQNRSYVEKKSSALLPTYVGMAVTHLLRDHFPRYVDLKFTAGMEEELDAIARGEIDWREFLRRFYRGERRRPGARPSASPRRLGAHRVPGHPRGRGSRRPASRCGQDRPQVRLRAAAGGEDAATA